MGPVSVQHRDAVEELRLSGCEGSYNGLEDHRANHTIPPFWLDDRSPLLRHENVRPAAGSCLRWAGHVARIGESRNAYRVLVGMPEGKRPLGRSRRRWEDNIKMDLREVGYDDRDRDRDRDRRRAYVRAAMNLRVP
ncbi:hypothetical protein ANN_04527 [Periplaneta americana]|uniref:Uncharacterized protein n=1 Tax=Periplaneta americana TaxID=6978 RepID=A0ABQ8T8T3_PERAM|nr:hypothetical protein ANN_04527 [Periplaneta americana]